MGEGTAAGPDPGLLIRPAPHLRRSEHYRLRLGGRSRRHREHGGPGSRHNKRTKLRKGNINNKAHSLSEEGEVLSPEVVDAFGERFGERGRNRTYNLLIKSQKTAPENKANQQLSSA